MAKTLKRSTKRKSKLPSIKSLEAKVWIFCRQMCRKKYPNTCFTCGKINLQGKDWATGHFIKKGKLPFALKYSELVLRPQCQGCNRGRNGNEAVYALNLLVTESPEYLYNIRQTMFTELENEAKWGAKEKRLFLINLINEYDRRMENYK